MKKKPGRTSPGEPLTLALGGGGARGLAHIGILEVLEKEDIPVKAIAGTSMGGLIGALYAAGVSLTEIEADIVRLAKPKEMLKLVDLGFSASGISVKGARICEYLTERLGGSIQFSDLRIPLALTAVDLLTGRDVVLRDGSVTTAVRATISIPGVFEPVDLDGLRLIDGGILNSVPVAIARTMTDGPVVGIDLLPRFRDNQPGVIPLAPPIRTSHVPGMIQDVAHVNLIMVSEMTEMKLQTCPPDALLRPDLPSDVSVLVGFKRAEEIIRAGRQAAEEALPRLHALVSGREGLSSSPTPPP